MTTAAASVTDPQWRPVTTAFVRRGADGRVLVVRRSDKVSTYRGMWGGISGGVEGAERLVDRAALEVLEEVDISQHQLQLVCCGRPLPVVDGHRHFLVHPFLFDLVPGASDAVTLNWENTAHRWVTPGELCNMPYVPLLPETLSRVLLPPSLQQHLNYLMQDREHGAAQLAAHVVEAFAAQLQPGGLLAAAGTPAADKESKGMLGGPATTTAAVDTFPQRDQQVGTSAGAPTAAASGPADTQPGTGAGPSLLATPATTTSSSRQSGQHILEALLDFGFLLATCRPSMAAIANAAAAVLLSLQRHLARSSSSSSHGATSPEERDAGGPDSCTLRSALQAAVQEERARLHSMAATSSTHASQLLVKVLGQQASVEAEEQLSPAPDSRRAVLTTSISSAVYRTLVEASNLLATTSTTSSSSSSRSTAGSAEEGTPAANRVPLSVIVCESRPLCEGVTLACQLSAAGLNATVITDAQAYNSLQDVGAVLLGCDAITQEGPVNKVGSALLALAARSKGIPVVVVGDSLKVSPLPVMATCLPYVLGSALSGGAAQHAAGGHQHAGEGTSRQAPTAVQGAAEAQEEEMDWKELSGAWKVGDAAKVAQVAAAAEQHMQNVPGIVRSGALRVRNVYFEAVPWSLVDRLVVDSGVLDEAGMAAQLGQQQTVYTEAFQLTLLTVG